MVSHLLQACIPRLIGVSFRRLIFAPMLLAAAVAADKCSAQLCGQLSGVTFSENFNTLATSGSVNQLSNGFEFAFNENPGNLTYSADNGSNASGDTYSYGSTGSSDRALGELTSGSVQSTVGACFVNNTNHPITSFVIGYTGEEWHLGAADAAIDRLDFQYSTAAGATLTSGTYVNVDALDFATPANTGAGAKNGNVASNRTVFAPLAITPSTPILPEQTFYVRWLPTNISGDNDGLAIDDFSIGTVLAPGVAGDYNNNGVVDAADYTIWRKLLNQAVNISNDITPGTVVTQDYTEWRNRFGKTTFDFGAGSATSIPEPASIWLAGTLVLSAWIFLSNGRR